MHWILWLLIVLAWSSDAVAQSTRLSNPNLAADNSISSTSKTPVLPCTANASAPSWTEGRQVPCSTDLNGNERVTLGTIQSGEDQASNLLQTSGGAVRGTQGNLLNAAVGNATSAAFTLPSGSKLITGRITGAGAVAQVITIYGGTASDMVVATSEVVCTLTLTGTSGGSGTALSCTPFATPYLFYIAVTSGSSGTPTTILTASY